MELSLVDLKPDLSVVLPCYKSAGLAAQSATALVEFFSKTTLIAEIVVVDDGGGDFDAHMWRELPGVRLIKLPVNQGKGAAVRAGMKATSGKVRIFTDVDLPYDADLMVAMYDYIVKDGFHVVIGDRNLPASSYNMVISWKRRLASAIFTEFVGRIVTGGGFFDTQCGLKAFRGDIAEQLFEMGKVNRFAFDVELVYMSLIHKLDIKRIPVRLRNNETSSVRLFQDSARMLFDVLSIKWHRMQGQYRNAPLRELLSQEFDEHRANANTHWRTSNQPATRN